jgi:hypothetical protein
MKARTFIVAAILGGACTTVCAAEFPANRSVPDARLDRIRGGFDLGDNLRASFALQRTVLINGMETMRTTITVPDIANITRDQAAALQDALRTTVVTNGAGGVAGAVPTAATQNSGAAASMAAATPAATSATSGAAATTLATVSAALPNSALPGLIVQNSLDNQAITATTTIDASVNSARMLENIRMAESVQDAVIQFRGN